MQRAPGAAILSLVVELLRDGEGIGVEFRDYVQSAIDLQNSGNVGIDKVNAGESAAVQAFCELIDGGVDERRDRVRL